MNRISRGWRSVSVLVWLVTLLLYSESRAAERTFGYTINSNFALSTNWTGYIFPISLSDTGLVPVNAYLASTTTPSQSSFYIGRGGDSTVIFSNNSQFSCKYLYIGNTNNGMLVINGGNHSNQFLRIACDPNLAGTGKLRFTGGTLTVSNSVFLGSTNGAGSIEFDGAGRLFITAGACFHPSNINETVFKFNGTTNSGFLEIKGATNAISVKSHNVVLDIGYAPFAFTNTFMRVSSTNRPNFLIERGGRYCTATVTWVTSGNTNTYTLTQRKIQEFRSTNELKTLLDVFPTSTRGLIPGTNQTFTASADYTNSGSSWWIPFSEEHVFQERLVNTQYYPDSRQCDLQRSWDLRVGHGGQIYSLRSHFGEAIPPQWRTADTNDPYYHGTYACPWMDEVFQTVVWDSTYPTEPVTERYCHHQAGIALNDTNADANGGGVVPFYSPYLGGFADVTNRNYRMVSWPQQPHVPTDYKSDIICYTEYRDIGQGILEASHVIYNFGCSTQNYVCLPWTGLRNTSFQNYFTSVPDGTMTRPPSNVVNSTLFNDTAGWAMACNGTGTNGFDDTLGIVFGQDSVQTPTWQWQSSLWNFSSAPSNLPNETNWVNRASHWTTHRVKIEPGKAFYGRYYLVCGSRTQVMSSVTTSLVTNCTFYVYTNAQSEVTNMCWYKSASGMPTTNSTATHLIDTHNKPLYKELPLFVLQSTLDDKISLSTDPYHYVDSDACVLKPYNGMTRYLGFLGYVSSPTNIVLQP